ncbi:MAG: thiamine ABC transporter substrate-binding protein [Anaerolineae bacterium]|nr:thiamine ABC transporter substrate-binding protein [Anaerolineae bacterium]
MKRLWLVVLFLIALLVTGCRTAPQTPEGPRVLRVMTYSSFDMSEEVIAAFTGAHNAEIQFLDAGDTGQMLNQAILSKANPQADVIYGLDNTFLSRALDAELFVPYAAKGLENVPDALKTGLDNLVTPVDYGDVCLNVDLAYFETHELAVPQSLDDLIQPAYKGLLVVQNPASSSPGLAFLITTIGAYGDDAFVDYWEALRANDVLVVEDWDTAYWGEFSGGAFSEGQYPLVVSYATSPAAEVYFSEGALETPPTGAMVTPGTCFRQVEYAAILQNNQNQDLAEAFLDFVLEDAFQSAIPLHMWVFPASQNAELPQVFADFAVEAESPIAVDAVQIESQRERWIEMWTQTVLR